MFSKDNRATTGRQSWCKICAAERYEEGRKTDPTAYSCVKSLWAQRNPDKMREYRWRYKHPENEYADIIPTTN